MEQKHVTTTEDELKSYCKTWFNGVETIVLRQIFKEIQLANGRTLQEELLNLDNLPCVKNFQPKVGQIRLSKEEFVVFAEKVKNICRD